MGVRWLKTDSNHKNIVRYMFYGMTVIICAIAFILGILYMVTEHYRKDNIIDAYYYMDVRPDSASVEPVIINSKGESVDFNELREYNTSIYGYIDIPDTDIQSPVEVNDYGRHTMLFTMSNNTEKFSERNVVVHVDSKRYPDIVKYKNADYVEGHSCVKVSSLESDMMYQIFAVGYCDNRNIMESYDFGSFSGMISYIEYVKKNSIYYDSSVNIDKQSGIITFSADMLGERLLVLAVMVM